MISGLIPCPTKHGLAIQTYCRVSSVSGRWTSYRVALYDSGGRFVQYVTARRTRHATAEKDMQEYLSALV